jgi:hypothetical protein
MKNKLFMAALVVAMVCGLALSACENGVQDVKIVYDKATAVASVSAVQTTNKSGVIVSWDAVADAGGYTVFIRQAGTKSVHSGPSGQSSYTYAVADGVSSVNTNPDKWSVYIPVGAGSNQLPTGKSYDIGVRTSPLTSGSISSITYSDIVWTTVSVAQ